METEKAFLLRCITLAEERLGFCAPNPAVGCVIVNEGKIIAEGFHWGAGYPHAEVDALKKLNNDATGATLYVSLEPCCHYGRTPPCTDLIKKSGVKKVVFGLYDPNPIVAGKGQAALIDAGIPCEWLSLPEIDFFYRAYCHWTKTKKPFVTAKIALSANYKIALRNKKPVKITGKEADELTHYYRKKSDAIFTTIETILNDDPKLNVRLGGHEIKKKIYIVDSVCRLPLDATIFKSAESITLFHSDKADLKSISLLEKNHVSCILMPENDFGLNLEKIVDKIGADGVQSLWIEAGATCFHSFLKQSLLNEIIIYLSSKKLDDDALSSDIDLEKLIRSANQMRKSTLGDDTVYTMEC